MEQGQEESEKVTGALRKARKDTDGLYDELTYLIEAFTKTADDPAPYEAFIRKWNGTLKIYQDMLDRKSGNSTGGTANPDGTGGGNENQNENPSTGGSGQGENPGGGTTPTTPDTPSDPGTGGDNSGGSSTGYDEG